MQSDLHKLSENENFSLAPSARRAIRSTQTFRKRKFFARAFGAKAAFYVRTTFRSSPVRAAASCRAKIIRYRTPLAPKDRPLFCEGSVDRKHAPGLSRGGLSVTMASSARSLLQGSRAAGFALARLVPYKTACSAGIRLRRSWLPTCKSCYEATALFVPSGRATGRLRGSSTLG